MENELTVKNVNFCGAGLLAVQEKETGKIYAGINSILRELGFDEKQIEYRRDKWISDKVLTKGTQKFSGTMLGLTTGRDTWCIEVKKLPLALAKLEITPKMEREMPELSQKLEEYQESCADVLAAAFLPQPHNVKQLTITSRDICKIVGKSLQSHGVILREIRDCIAELQEMGFNTLEFFQESQYLAGNNEHRPQFIVTERGCEFYSRRLEPEERQIFIAEFKDRFQRMQDVLDGKPVKAASREPSTAVVSGAGTADIKLFSNGKMGLVVAGDKFYTIAADRLPFIEKAVTELLQSNVPRMDEIINSMFSASCKQWDYELVTSYNYAERTETP